VPDRDDEPRPDQHRHVTGVDHLGGVGELLVLDVPRGPQHQPGDLTDRLGGGPVPVRGGLLGGELVQAEDPADGRHRAPVRLVQPEPDVRVLLALRLPGGVGVVRPARPPDTVVVDGAVDDGVRIAPLGLGAGPRRPGQALDELAELAWEHARPAPPQPEHPGSPIARRPCGDDGSGCPPAPAARVPVPVNSPVAVWPDRLVHPDRRRIAASS
jgi:hypothetical protein